MDNSWIAHTKGGPERPSFEIAVIRKSNAHGIESYGWFGQNKLLISHSGGPCTWPVTEMVWEKLVTLANEVADAMNKAESTVTIKTEL